MPPDIAGGANWTSSLQVTQFYVIFSGYLTTWPRYDLTLICDLWPHEHIYINQFGSIWTSTSQMRPSFEFCIFGLSYNLVIMQMGAKRIFIYAHRSLLLCPSHINAKTRKIWTADTDKTQKLTSTVHKVTHSPTVRIFDGDWWIRG